MSEHAHLGTGPLPDHGHQVAKCSTGGRKTALRRWPSGHLYLSEGTSKGRRQGREKAAGTEVELQDKGLRAGEGLGPTDRRGVNSRNPAVRWAPPTAALWTGSASKTHILKTSFSAHAGILEGAGKFRRWGPGRGSRSLRMILVPLTVSCLPQAASSDACSHLRLMGLESRQTLCASTDSRGLITETEVEPLRRLARPHTWFSHLCKDVCGGTGTCGLEKD